MAKIIKYCYDFGKKSKCYSNVIRVYKRETIPADYNTQTKTKQKFVPLGWFCNQCKKFYGDDIQ